MKLFKIFGWRILCLKRHEYEAVALLLSAYRGKWLHHVDADSRRFLTQLSKDLKEVS